MRLFRIFSMVSCWQILGANFHRTRQIWKNGKKTHYTSQLATSLSTSLTTFYIDSSIKSLQIPDHISPSFLLHARSRTGKSAQRYPNAKIDTHKRTGGAVGLIMVRVELRTPLFAVWKKNCPRFWLNQFFGQFFSIHFFPRKSHYGVYDIVDTTLPWHACDGQVSRFRATKTLKPHPWSKRIKLPCHWHWSSRSWYPNRKLVSKKMQMYQSSSFSQLFEKANNQANTDLCHRNSPSLTIQRQDAALELS